MSIRQRIIGAAGALLVGSALFAAFHSADIAEAASRPAAHWGTFTKPATLGPCLSMARKALYDHGFTPDPTTYDYMIVGYNDRIFVSVVCVPRPQNAWVAVSAYSDDSVAAAEMRNSVREAIVRMVSFD